MKWGDANSHLEFPAQQEPLVGDSEKQALNSLRDKSPRHCSCTDLVGRAPRCLEPGDSLQGSSAGGALKLTCSNAEHRQRVLCKLCRTMACPFLQCACGFVQPCFVSFGCSLDNGPVATKCCAKIVAKAAAHKNKGKQGSMNVKLDFGTVESRPACLPYLFMHPFPYPSDRLI